MTDLNKTCERWYQAKQVLLVELARGKKHPKTDRYERRGCYECDGLQTDKKCYRRKNE